MPHVKPLHKMEAHPDTLELLTAIEKKYEGIPSIFAILAYQPDVLTGVATINDGIQKDLPATLRELAYLKASLVNGCEYCAHHHKKAAKKAGVSEEQLKAIGDYQSSDKFSEVEKHVLAYAEQLTETGNVDASTVESVKQHLSDQQLVTLAATVALANFTNRFNHGLGIELP
jgi:uncharacterized peroxidase-related enzyme